MVGADCRDPLPQSLSFSGQPNGFNRTNLLQSKLKRMLILITGKQGAGKGHVARECTQTGIASHIEVDSILNASKIPKHGDLSRTNWDRWRNASPTTREKCITRGFNKSLGRLSRKTPHLIVEGAILCNEWFTEPLLSVLQRFFDDDFEIHHYYLNPTNSDILQNVHERANTDMNRRHELTQFPNENAIADFHSGFDHTIRDSHQEWECFKHANELIDTIKRQLLIP